MNYIIELLRSGDCVTINKKLARKIGINAAMMYSELLSRYCYFRDKGKLDSNDYFYNTVADIEDCLCLSKFQQSKIIQKLKKLGLIDCKVKGMPAKRYFKIIENTKYYNECITGVINEK